MSAIGEIKFHNSIDKKYRILNSEFSKPVYNLKSGVKAIEYKHLPSSQNTSVTSTEYLIQPTNGQLVSTLMSEEVTVTFTFTFTNATTATAPAAPFPKGALCTTFMPLSQSTNTLTVAINGQPFKVSNSDIVSLMMSFNKSPELNGRDLVSASQLDTFTENLALGTTGFDQQQAALVQPRLDYFSSTYGNNSRFGSVVWDFSILNAAGERGDAIIPNDGNPHIRIISCTVREPLFSGVNALCSEDESNWVGVNSIQINRTFVGNFATRFLRYTAITAGLTCTVPTWVFNPNIPTLYYKLTSMPDNVEIPKSTWYTGYSYDSMSVQQCGNVVQPGQAGYIYGQTVTTSSVPAAIYVAVMYPGSQRNALNASDAPGHQITNISVGYGGTASQFASLSNAYEVYKELSVSEGFVKMFQETGYALYYDASSTQYQQMGLYGSILRIDATKLCLDWTKYSVGCAFNTSLSVAVNFINLSSQPVQPYLYVIPVTNVVYNVAGSTCTVYKSLLSQEEVAAVRRSNPIITNENTQIGGNIFDSMLNGLKSFGSTVWDNRKDILDTAKSVMPLVGLGKKKPRMHGRGFYENEEEYESDDDEKHGGSVISKSYIKKKLKFLN